MSRQQTQHIHYILLLWKQKACWEASYWWGGNQSMGAEVWSGVRVYDCVMCLCERTRCTMHILVLDWNDFGVWRRCTRINTRELSLCALPSPFFFLPSLFALEFPSSSLWAASAGAKITITFFFFTSVLSFVYHDNRGWSRKVKDETRQGMLPHLFIYCPLLSNGLSHPVTPHYTQLIQCVIVTSHA